MQITKLKSKFADVDDRLDAEYDSGLAFSYKCIMFMLKKEYPELNMSKLEAGVQEYMAKQGQGDQDRDKAPSSGEQEKETGGPILDAGRESAPAPSEAVGISLSKIADRPSVEAIDPSTHNP